MGQRLVGPLISAPFVQPAAMSADGNRLACVTLRPPDLPIPQRIASAAGTPGSYLIRVWEVEAQQQVGTPILPWNQVSNLAVSHDGTYVAVLARGNVTVLKVSDESDVMTAWPGYFRLQLRTTGRSPECTARS